MLLQYIWVSHVVDVKGGEVVEGQGWVGAGLHEVARKMVFESARVVVESSPHTVYKPKF